MRLSFNRMLKNAGRRGPNRLQALLLAAALGTAALKHEGFILRWFHVKTSWCCKDLFFHALI